MLLIHLVVLVLRLVVMVLLLLLPCVQLTSLGEQQPRRRWGWGRGREQQQLLGRPAKQRQLLRGMLRGMLRVLWLPPVLAHLWLHTLLVGGGPRMLLLLLQFVGMRMLLTPLRKLMLHPR